MKWHNKASELDDDTMKRILTVAQDMVRPTLTALPSQSDEEQRDSVISLTLGLAVALGIIAQTYYKASPEAFSEHIGELISNTMRDIEEMMDKTKHNKEDSKYGWTSLKKATGWDTH